jgi:antitoxin component YwqK of YwqJK toxin-antitoxin module
MQKLLFYIFCVFQISVMAQNKGLKQNFYKDENGQKTNAKLSEGYVFYSDERLLSDIDNMPKDLMRVAESGLRKDGKWTYWHLNGKVQAEEYYLNGIKTGVWKIFNDLGILETEINYETGILQTFHPNSVKNSQGSINVSNDVSKGLWQAWHDNGKINYEGKLNDEGVNIGTWKWYNRDGVLITTQEFDTTGKLISTVNH